MQITRENGEPTNDREEEETRLLALTNAPRISHRRGRRPRGVTIARQGRGAGRGPRRITARSRRTVYVHPRHNLNLRAREWRGDVSRRSPVGKAESETDAEDARNQERKRDSVGEKGKRETKRNGRDTHPKVVGEVHSHVETAIRPLYYLACSHVRISA